MSDSCRPVQVLYCSFPLFLFHALPGDTLAFRGQIDGGQQHL